MPKGEAAGLALSGYVARTMAADLHIDMATQQLQVRNAGNESFKLVVQDSRMPEQLQRDLASVIPAHMRKNFAFKFSAGTDAKASFSVSIQAP